MQVEDIALKAIEGASWAKALSHINQIAMEQAKHAHRYHGSRVLCAVEIHILYLLYVC